MLIDYLNHKCLLCSLSDCVYLSLIGNIIIIIALVMSFCTSWLLVWILMKQIEVIRTIEKQMLEKVKNDRLDRKICIYWTLTLRSSALAVVSWKPRMKRLVLLGINYEWPLPSECTSSCGVSVFVETLRCVFQCLPCWQCTHNVTYDIDWSIMNASCLHHISIVPTCIMYLLFSWSTFGVQIMHYMYIHILFLDLYSWTWSPEY